MPISSRFVIQATTAFLIVGFLALFGIVGMTVWLNDRAQIYFDESLAARDTRNAAIELRDAVRTAEASQRGFLLTGNEIYLAPYDTAKALAQRQIGVLRRSLANEDRSTPMLGRLTSVLDEKIAEMDQTIALKSARQDAAALAAIRTNRGKALMDEANVFLYGIILSAEERLSLGGIEQQRNAAMLRWVSIIGAIVIIVVVGGVTFTVLQYARETAQARDEVRQANLTLEDRVKQRTADLALARERAEVLLAEVNHRVANSLQLVASLVKLQSNAVKDAAAKEALAETQGRIYAISLIHRSLYGSGDVRFVALDEYLRGLLEHLETSMRAEGHTASLRHEIEPMKLRTDTSVNLGVVVTEWVTNAFKYAYPEHPGEIRVRLKRNGSGKAELVVEDDGVGRSEVAPVKGTGLGTRIVNVLAAAMQAQIEYLPRERGTAARIAFTAAAE
jgi:two-component sensor histidine kinase/CHASE3 domain sensor protein